MNKTEFKQQVLLKLIESGFVKPEPSETRLARIAEDYELDRNNILDATRCYAIGVADVLDIYANEIVERAF